MIETKAMFKTTIVNKELERSNFQIKNVKKSLNKIPLSNTDGIEFVPPFQVLYCKAEGSYTYVIMENKKVLISKQLGKMEEILTPHNFLRIHRSYIVNLDHIKKYFKNDGGYLIMTNGDKLAISRRKKQQLKQLF